MAFPMVFREVEVWALCRTLGTSWREIDKDVLHNCALPRFGEEPYMGVMVWGAHTFGHKVVGFFFFRNSVI